MPIQPSLKASWRPQKQFMGTPSIYREKGNSWQPDPSSVNSQVRLLCLAFFMHWLFGLSGHDLRYIYS
jgi:hypothetical protein